MSSPAEKTRLSAEQKKQNHIESERKRREAIRSGFEKLSEKVPDSKGKASSEGVVLANTVKHIQQLQARKEELRKQAEKQGMEPLRFEQHYRDVRKDMRAAKGESSRTSSTPTSFAGPSTSGPATSGGGASSKSNKSEPTVKREIKQEED